MLDTRPANPVILSERSDAQHREESLLVRDSSGRPDQSGLPRMTTGHSTLCQLIYQLGLCGTIPKKRKGIPMSLRLVITITAASGKGSELAKAMAARCTEVVKEHGCEQYEIFQSAVHPDKLILLERWTTQAALDAHAKVNSARPPLPPELRAGTGEREDYEYNRVR